jgi:opacity protein-like surface antigen
MKQKIVFGGFLVTTLFLFSTQSKAATAASFNHSAGLMVGQVWPSGNFGQNIEGSVGPGIFYEYAASDIFSVYAEALKSTHASDSLKITSYAAGIKSVLIYIDKLAPYAEFGMGLYNVDQAVAAGTASKTLFGFNIGVGADLDLNDRVFAGMVFQFHNIFTGTAELPNGGHTEISGRWSGLFIRGGFRF